MRHPYVIVVGAGIGGLAAAVDLAARGVSVTVLERAPVAGGKMHTVEVDGLPIDAGPTVFTMRRVFDELFADAGATFASRVALHPVETLARHAWDADTRLDLFTDLDRSADAIGDFAGAREARGYRAFSARAQRMLQSLEPRFIRAERPSVMGLTRAFGARGLSDLLAISPFSTLWSALGEHFRDPRLRQLFGRYATYCGSSPFLAPATLMLIAHVEREGVWLVEGGMQRIAQSLADLASDHGATFRYEAEVHEITVRGGRATGVLLANAEQIEADAVVLNADVAALAEGRFGIAAARAVGSSGHADKPAHRSLSAITWAMRAKTSGFPLLHHSVFFSRDSAAEFDALFTRSRVPDEATVYVCAQDRSDREKNLAHQSERLLCLINAPAIGDSQRFDTQEIDACRQRAFNLMERCGLEIDSTPQATIATTPTDFARRFPSTGGALYGQATHGWQASFQRSGARTKLPGLWLAGGSVHPGAGVPMAALSGRTAAAHILADLASTSRSATVAMRGGTPTR